MYASLERLHLMCSFSLVHGMIVHMVGVVVRPDLHNLTLTIEADNVDVIVDELLACPAPPRQQISPVSTERGGFSLPVLLFAVALPSTAAHGLSPPPMTLTTS